MQTIDVNSLEHSQVYTLYSVYKAMSHDLEIIQDKSEDDNEKLRLLNLQLEMIENFAETKMAERLHWTKEEILLNYGNTPTLILTFHPGSDGYRNFGKELVVNIDFPPEELIELLQNIQNKVARVPGTIHFKKVPEMTEGQLSTYDIFELAGRKI